jgi:hypothetical protein
MSSLILRSKGFGVTAAMVLVVTVAAPDNGRAESRIAGHPAHVHALPHPSMRPLQTGTVIAAPVAQVPPRAARPDQQGVAAPHAEDTAHAGDHSPRGPRIIVVGVPSAYYYGDPYSDGDPATGPSQPGDNDNGMAYCRSYSSYDPASRAYVGDDGKLHPCP